MTRQPSIAMMNMYHSLNTISTFVKDVFTQLTQAIVLLFIACFSPWVSAAGESTAFFYGPNPPINTLSQFDRLILEPENIKPQELVALAQHGSRRYAYISIGEIGPHRPWAGSISADWVLGENSDWGSKVVDLDHPGWQSFVLQRVTQLVSRGYDGLFLDTLDSYAIYAKTANARREQQEALGNLIYRIKRRFPRLNLIANRGFEVLDSSAQYLEAVAAESLYASWNNARQQYKPVVKADREWLLGKLNHAHQTLNLDVIVIDYLPPDRRSEARDVALKISNHGFVPWVATPSLDYIGISNLEVLPREVLMLYDSQQTGPINEAQVEDLLAVPLEYMGYVPVYLDVRTRSLPVGELQGRYAGVVIWCQEEIAGIDLYSWLSKQIDARVPVAMFGVPAFRMDNSFASKIGVSLIDPPDMATLHASLSDDLIGFETAPLPRLGYVGVPMQSVSKENSVHLRYADKKRRHTDLVITGPWGGLALHPGVHDPKVDKIAYWILDPYKFLRKALSLPDAPMPDITTENGRRLWLAHIDGDAMPSWAEMPGRKLGSEIIDEYILDQYQYPHTISIVEAEINALPQYTDRRERMVAIARKIFARENVEIATHTFSHPYSWPALAEGTPSGTENLPISGYRYSTERELAGSAAYIDNVLAPADKKTRVILWSGDALPDEHTLAVADKHSLINMNGGDTTITHNRPVLSLVSPMARIQGAYTQVYAPIMNENVYTNEWLGPFDGFRRVIETMKLTDIPYRLKPMNIYYHFYAGTKAATMRSLKEIYDWTLSQDNFPVYVSEYASKVPEFRSAGVARYLDGRWKISGLKNIRSLRTLSTNMWPELNSTDDLIGAKKLHDGIYFHTAATDHSVTFNTVSKSPTVPHLVSANAAVISWSQENSQLQFRLRGHVPVVMELSASSFSHLCTINAAGSVLHGSRTKHNSIRFEFTTKDTGNAFVDCPA